jgi:hypothetical protein
VTTGLVLFLFALPFVIFLALEMYALSDREDKFHTLSTYIKRIRRRTGIYGSIVLTVAIFAPAVWLWGHLVLEAW